MDLSFIADAIDGEGEIDYGNDLDRFDLNGDGDLTADDCPFPGGSLEAKLWWKNVLQPYVASQATDAHVAEFGDSVVGAYQGKPLVPGVAGPGQGDFQYLVDKLRVTQGLSYSSAAKIAGKIKVMKYGS